MKRIILTVEENKCLRECLKTIESILYGRGLSTGGGIVKKEAVKKEPTQKQRVNNYTELLSSGSKYQKPKHLQK